MKFRFVKMLACGLLMSVLAVGTSGVSSITAHAYEWTVEDEAYVQEALQEFRNLGWSEDDIKQIEETIRWSRYERRRAETGDTSLKPLTGYELYLRPDAGVPSSDSSAVVTDPATVPNDNQVIDNTQASDNNQVPDAGNQAGDNKTTDSKTNVTKDNETEKPAVKDNEITSEGSNEVSGIAPNNGIITDEQLKEVDETTGRTMEELLRVASVTAELDNDVVKVVVQPRFNDTVVQSYSFYSNEKNISFPSVEVSDREFTCDMPENYSGTYFIIVETSEGTLHSNIFGIVEAEPVVVQGDSAQSGSSSDGDVTYVDGTFAVNYSGIPESCNEGDTVTITFTADVPVKLEFNGVAVGRGVFGTSFDAVVSSNGTYTYKAVSENNEVVVGSIDVDCFKPVEDASSNTVMVVVIAIAAVLAVIAIIVLVSRGKQTKKGAEESEITEEDL